MLRQLSPTVHRQAVRLVGRSSPLVEDLYQEGRIKLWMLLQEGERNPAYLLASTRNCMLNALRHERYEPEPFPTEDPDPWTFIPAQDSTIADALTRCLIEQHEGNLASAMTRVAFTGEPMTSAERVALHRYRRSAEREEWL
ncbi:MAG: RNA polymerase sigma factor [Armatimonadota bacterium]|jgi:DNA-directed RNA polymerase specialized sigma24 family protein